MIHVNKPARSHKEYIMIVTKEMGYIPQDTTITAYDPVFIDVEQEPFKFYGLYKPFIRMPLDVAKEVSEGVYSLAQTTTGGRIRFKTDSDYIVVHFYNYPITADDVAANAGNCDCYIHENGRFAAAGCFNPSQGTGKPYFESRVMLKKGMKDIVIDLPTFGRIKKMYIAVREGSEILAGDEYKYKTPVVFYGSSIVHGVGSSKNGCTYPNIISRKLDTDYINLGFSGRALAEEAMMEYLKTLKMSVFVYDYDHNAPNSEHLIKTHYRGYRIVRDANPDVPIIFASKVDYYNCYGSTAACEERKGIIYNNYLRAISEGDKNVYFVEGKSIYEPEYREESTFDGCHPNDVGYLSMAKAFMVPVKKALGIE